MRPLDCKVFRPTVQKIESPKIHGEKTLTSGAIRAIIRSHGKKTWLNYEMREFFNRTLENVRYTKNVTRSVRAFGV